MYTLFEEITEILRNIIFKTTLSKDQLQLLEVKICHFCGREALEPDDCIIRTNASVRDMPLVSLKFRSGGNDKQVIYLILPCIQWLFRINCLCKKLGGGGEFVGLVNPTLIHRANFFQYISIRGRV